MMHTKVNSAKEFRPIAKGIYHDVLRDKRTGEVIDFGWRNNIVVNECRSLIATLMKNGGASGVNRIEFGRGDAVWDEDGAEIPTPRPETNRLLDTNFVDVAVAAADINYLTLQGELSPDSLPTNIIEVNVNLPAGTLATGSDIFPLREFALFGEITVDAVTTKYMIDYVRHAVININADHELMRSIRLVF